MAEKNEDKYKRGRYRKQAEKSVIYPQSFYAGKSKEYAIEDEQKRMAFDRGREPNGKRIKGSQYNEEGKYVKRTGKNRVAGPSKPKSVAKKPQTRKKSTHKRVAGK
jgi:hypothetical protein